MKKCSCGHQIQLGDNYCADCGKAVQLFLYVCLCGHRQDGGNRYCIKCGEITTFGMMTSLWKEIRIKKEIFYPPAEKELLRTFTDKFSNLQCRA